MASPSSSGPALVVSLQTDKQSYVAADQQRLAFNMANASDRDITVLKWRTPLEGFKSNMFAVEVDGRPVPYLGRVYKRGAPTEDDYITIPANGDVTETVDLSEAYDIARSGIYSITYRSDRVQAGSAGAGDTRATVR